MKKTAFVILHYQMLRITCDCIESIRKLEGSTAVNIVVVDNGSPDGSGKLLKEKYEKCQDVTVILSDKNLGFANGNNLGYRFAREELKAECIIVMNNDILFSQSDFLILLEKRLKNEKGDVIGPDIVTPENTHQNPFRLCSFTCSDVKRALFNKRIFLAYFYIKKWLHLDKKIFVLENMFDRRSKNRRESIDWRQGQYGVVLQGACIVFAPGYVEYEQEAFCPETFMYGEEDILAEYCRQKGYRMVYMPELSVLHLDGCSTDNSYKQSIEKQIFVYRNTINSLKILKKLMKQNK